MSKEIETDVVAIADADECWSALVSVGQLRSLLVLRGKVSGHSEPRTDIFRGRNQTIQ